MSYNGGIQVMLGWLSLDRALGKGHTDKWHSGQDPRDQGLLPYRGSSKCHCVSWHVLGRGSAGFVCKGTDS